MTVAVPDALAAEIVAVLRGTGARFGLLHGSRAAGSPRADSNVDVAAWWLSDPPGVDLVVLNGASLELAGGIALHGRVLFDDDPPARVRWTATTRKIYADEQPRLLRSHHEFAEAIRRG
ncbi:MAG: nucleotidyltransferase domain-containing protein [Pseudonocardiaceae bacterium]